MLLKAVEIIEIVILDSQQRPQHLCTQRPEASGTEGWTSDRRQELSFLFPDTEKRVKTSTSVSLALANYTNIQYRENKKHYKHTNHLILIRECTDTNHKQTARHIRNSNHSTLLALSSEIIIDDK